MAWIWMHALNILLPCFQCHRLNVFCWEDLPGDEAVHGLACMYVLAILARNSIRLVCFVIENSILAWPCIWARGGA